MNKSFKYLLYGFGLLIVALALLIIFKTNLFSKTINLSCKGSETTDSYLSGNKATSAKLSKLEGIKLTRENIPFSPPQIKITQGSNSFSSSDTESNIHETNLHITATKITENENQIVSINFVLNKVTKELLIEKTVDNLKNKSERYIFFIGTCSEVAAI